MTAEQTADKPRTCCIFCPLPATHTLTTDDHVTYEALCGSHVVRIAGRVSAQGQGVTTAWLDTPPQPGGAGHGR